MYIYDVWGILHLRKNRYPCPLRMLPWNFPFPACKLHGFRCLLLAHRRDSTVAESMTDSCPSCLMRTIINACSCCFFGTKCRLHAMLDRGLRKDKRGRAPNAGFGLNCGGMEMIDYDQVIRLLQLRVLSKEFV